MPKLLFKDYLIESTEHKKSKIKNVLDGKNLILFFKNQGKMFGAPEESRIVFARLKNPDMEDSEVPDDANFLAYDLLQALMGNSTENLFSSKDMDNIDVVDRDNMEKMLLRCPDSPNSVHVKRSKDIGVIKLKDEE